MLYKNSHLAISVLVNFIIQEFLQIAAQLLTSFSHERKSERIERKFNTQNPNLCIKSLLYSAEPSTILVRGLENHSLKSLWDSKTWGIRKCIKDHNSIKLFCKGVPVSKSLPPTLGKLSSNCHLCDLKFFICWASSKIKYCHCFLRKLE